MGESTLLKTMNTTLLIQKTKKHSPPKIYQINTIKKTKIIITNIKKLIFMYNTPLSLKLIKIIIIQKNQH